jgi:DNA mismatch endonuclease (patch repair protein)
MEFWTEKFRGTVERDERKARELHSQGWNVITVWECDIAKQPEAVVNGIRSKLAGSI